MYSTARKNDGAIWAAHQYNVSFDQEIGHFQHCNGAAVPATPFGVNGNGTPISCPPGAPPTTAGRRRTRWPAATTTSSSRSPSRQLVRVQGCTDTNTGFDGGLILRPGRTATRRCTRRPLSSPAPLTGSAFNEW